jgi:DNA topoisomerase-1
VLDSLNELLGPHVFPDKGDGADPRLCPVCGRGQLSLKLGKFGAFIGCSNYPDCRYTRVLSPSGAENGEGEKPGVRVLGEDPETGEEIALRNGRFGDYVQQGEGEKPKRSSLPRGLNPEDVTLEKALALLSLPREVARHPTSGEPILAGIGRYGAYVQHGKTYANLGRDDDVLEIGANRAIDLIVAKESGAAVSRFGGGAARALGEPPEGGPVSVKQGRFGAYVNHGKINATIPRDRDPAMLTLDEAIALLKAKAEGGGVSGRLLGEHPEGGPVTVREGRFGPYVNWGKVNATIPKSIRPDSISLDAALELIAEREDRPASARKAAGKAPASKAAAGKTQARETPAKTAPAKRVAAKSAPSKAAAAETPAAKANPKAVAKKR